MAMNFILSHWVGWHSIPKKMEVHPLSACNLTQQAYMTGVNDFIQHQKAEDAKETEVTNGENEKDNDNENVNANANSRNWRDFLRLGTKIRSTQIPETATFLKI